MKAGELFSLNRKTRKRNSRVWRPFLRILFCAGFLMSTLLSLKTAYFRLSELGVANLTGGSDAIYYFNSSAELQEGLTLDDEDAFEILFAWQTTGLTREKNPLPVQSYLDFENAPFRITEGRLPASSQEMLVRQSWASRHQVQPGDTVEITDMEGAYPFTAVISGIYESTQAGETLISLLDPEDAEGQGQIALKKGPRFDPQSMENLPPGLRLDDFAGSLSSQKEETQHFVLQAVPVLMGCFALFILVYCRILVQQNREMRKQLQILGLSRKDQMRLRLLDYFVTPFCILSAGVLTSAAVCSLLLNEKTVQMLFPAWQILSGQYRYVCSLSAGDWLAVLAFVLVVSLLSFASSFAPAEGFRRSVRLNNTEKDFRVPGYRKSLRRIPGRALIVLLLVLLQVLWQISSQSFLSWIRFYRSDPGNEHRISADLLSKNVSAEDLAFLSSLNEDFPEVYSFRMTVSPNVSLRSTTVMAVPDGVFEDLLRTGEQCDPADSQFLSQDPSLADQQTLQLQTPVAFQSQFVEVNACIVQDYGVYQNENSPSEILVSFTTLENWLKENSQLPEEERTDWPATVYLQLDSEDPALTVQKLETCTPLYDRFQVSLANNAESFRMQQTREILLLGCALTAGALVMACGLYTFFLIQKGSMEKYRRDFETYHSLGVSDAALNHEVLRSARLMYAEASLISSVLLLLTTPAFLNPGWLCFLAVFYLLDLGAVRLALRSFRKKS